MRSGADYVRALDDGRCVYVNGDKVSRVADHPAFAGVVATMAAVYDASCAEGSPLVDPGTGRLAIFTCPRTREQHELRRTALEQWSALTHGFIGRGPDHVAGLLAGFSSRPELFDTERHQLGRGVQCYHRYAAERGLWVTNSIVPPQANPNDPTSRVRPVRLVEETAEGIVVDGAQMLGTGAAVADAIFVTSIRPLAPDETDRAVSFVVPISAPGLKLLCRRPYATAGEPFDYPLSTRFDETDAMVVFDRVLVPWSSVFAAGDVTVVNSQFFGTAAHQIGNLQSIIRLTAKLRFVTGVASLIVKANGRDTDPAIKGQLAELATVQTVSEALTHAAHSHAERDEYGVYRPAGKYLYAALGMQTEVYPKAIKLLGELAGGGVIQVPSSVRDFDDPEELAAMDVLMGSDRFPVAERVKLFKLAWDLVGSEFAGRHVQYERFYSGAVATVRAHAHRFYPFADAEALVGDFLASYRA
ncbi:MULTISPECIES: 4-hydroxyphenylacetate 3-hydroxylase family protein [Mycolicibacterium]|jgi:4-hydroxyphenylacetate 3-monooxygenase|uniref:4-hydroxyphenylacetate 3-hydroxylase n=2 Tax=Mycolicibacterium TaxID=1866885 RepID=A1T9V8_MYCVP|nr:MULTISPECIES: 4-hydroxyphenylacetate 3-hydroxylase N-terminal domain-containing protein [Mycolicibacterium]ABM13958.1 4-hydroxyphenylacetate 3-hydroxylase [Mycolicibacterium vanbaalenii PYR-1]MCV7129539.1 4-hydroxyphenylacetate 3-hydroxylase [Mycolicibacterium vanbaalenii PYR-1]MDN4518702.1 4-hydroxyphenylacetate 3-hydroxylase N-terminal domain-containing protein [Mycolicibacterium austroafricanum]PQP46006.1 4-hydroxyphenylacetate 3-hydroxylase [Mycolicibacterium austroafricanum]QRZ04371.1 